MHIVEYNKTGERKVPKIKLVTINITPIYLVEPILDNPMWAYAILNNPITLQAHGINPL